MRLTLASVLAAVLLVGTAACGDSDDSGQTDAPDSGANAPVQHPKSLKGEVGEDDAFAISLTDEKGEAITNLAAGEYELEVEDYSAMHNFHLLGVDPAVVTTVGEKTEKTFTVTFEPGEYTYQCDPHASQMKGTFTVT